jgi:LCP family protein required for cell wall assembly
VATTSHRGVKVTLLVIGLVLLLVVGAVLFMWFDLNGKLHNRNVDDLLGSSRPTRVENTNSATVTHPGDPFPGRAMNILVMGTDSRDGANSATSGDEVAGARSDTTFIAHVSADRTRAEAIFIPRDTMITMPECLKPDKTVIPEAGNFEQFNSAYSHGDDYGGTAGGAACVIRAVEEMTDVQIDAYVVVDFAGFTTVVDSIGGLDITMLCRLYAPDAGGLDLPEGVVHIDGAQAVQLARARTGVGVGDGSDLGRVEREKALLRAILSKVITLNYVTDFPKLYGLASAVLSSVTTDLGNVAEFAGFAYTLRGLNLADVQFETLPVADWSENRNRVVVDHSRADYLWQDLRNDQPLGSAYAADHPAAAPDPSSTEDPAVADPSQTPTVPADASGEAGATTQPQSTAPPTIQRPTDCDW